MARRKAQQDFDDAVARAKTWLAAGPDAGGGNWWSYEQALAEALMVLAQAVFALANQQDDT